MRRSPSLRRPLILYPLAFQFGVLLISFAVLLGVAVRLDSGGPYADEQIVPVIARAIARNGDGGLSVRSTPELVELRRQSPDLWFVAEDDLGRSVSYGRVPGRYASLLGSLSHLSYAQFRDRQSPHDLTAVLRREAVPIGSLTILAHGRLTELGFVVLMASNVIVLPIFILLVFASLIVTPWIVRRALAGLSRVAREAQEIDHAHRGRCLSEALVPIEIVPVVRAMNAALRRLDEGFERQSRFIASAAHELRTPIAILLARVEAAGSAETRALGPSVQRLATLAEQLLDLQRLDHSPQEDPLDLAVLVRGVIADLAPLLIASNVRIGVVVARHGLIQGDAAALERVVINLVQNAVEHGGRRVVVRVEGSALEVQDDGPGIPPQDRERVLEPFHRLRPRSSGSGLGLSLVQEVVKHHGGRVSIRDAAGGGTIVRIDL